MGTTTKDRPDTFSTQVVNGITVLPYIYSYSTSVDPLPRGGHGFVKFGNALYVFGGSIISMTTHIITPGSDYSNELWKYDLATNSWSYIVTVNPPTARKSGAFFVNGSTAYLLFGYGVVGGVPTHIDGLMSYNFMTQTWATVATLADATNGRPVARQMFGYAIHSGSLYVFGGMAGNPFVDVGDIWSLNLTTFQWTRQLVSTLIAKNSFWVAVVGGHAYLFGGQTNFTATDSQLKFGFSTNVLKDITHGNVNKGFVPDWMYNMTKTAIIADPNLLSQALNIFQLNGFPASINSYDAFFLGRLGAATGYRSFTLGIGGATNEVIGVFAIAGLLPLFKNQALVKLNRYDVTASTWSIVNSVVIPYAKADMNSITEFGCYASGLATSYVTGQTVFDYEVFVDDGFAGPIAANYHTGLWKIVIRYTSATTTWSFVSSVRMVGKGVFIANTVPNTFTLNNIAVGLVNNALQYTTTLKSRDVSLEALLIRP